MKKILFVCVENSNRSQMAEAFVRIHGTGNIEAHSAGSRPSGRVNPRAIEAMKEVGYDLTMHRSKGLEDFNGSEVDVAVTMGCGDECPLVRAKTRIDWQIPDPREMTPDQFRAVRDLVEIKVKQLIEASIPANLKMASRGRQHSLGTIPLSRNSGESSLTVTRLFCAARADFGHEQNYGRRVFRAFELRTRSRQLMMSDNQIHIASRRSV